MDKEISTCRSAFIADFKKRASELEDRLPVCLQLVEVFGQRWSYIAGSIPQAEQMVNHFRIQINTYFGLIVYSPAVVDEAVIIEIREVMQC